MRLMTTLGCKAADKFESQRSADILSRIVLDADFAIHVKGIRIFAPTEREQSLSFAFQLGTQHWTALCRITHPKPGMISNALLKLTNLRRVHITMRWKDLHQILKMLNLHCPKMSGLSIEYGGFIGWLPMAQ